MRHSTQKVIAVFVGLLAVTALGTVIVSASATIAKNDKASEKSEKENKKPMKENKSKKVTDAEIDKTQKQNKSIEKVKQQKENNDGASKVMKKEKQQKQEKIAQDVAAVVEENEAISEEVDEVIEEVKGQNKFKKMLVGTDYKNLGQLRSGLVKNRNQIRKLTRSIEGATPEDQVIIAAQLATLTQEREQVKSFITNNEEGFSVLGWAFRLINGYPDEPVDDVEENNLAEEVEEALEDVAEDENDEDLDEDDVENEEIEETEDVEQNL